MTSAHYWRWADRCLLSWNLLKISRINSSLHSSFNSLLKKRAQVADLLCDELVFLMDQKGYTHQQLQVHYDQYRSSATDAMRADTYRSENKADTKHTQINVATLPGAHVSSAQTSTPSSSQSSQHKQSASVSSKEMKEVKWFSYWREASNLEQQTNLFVSPDHLGQRERKRYDTLTKDKERLKKKCRKHIKWVSSNSDIPSATRLAQLQVQWAKWQVSEILPKQIKNQLFRLEHAKYVSDKPLLRDVEYAHLRKQKQYKKSTARVRIQFDKLKSLVQFFNSVFQLLPLDQRPPQMSLIDESLSEQKQSLQVIIRKCLGDSLLSDEPTPHQLLQFCKLSDKLARINQSLKDNIQDRGFYHRFLTDRITALRGMLTLPGLQISGGTITTKRTDCYAFEQ